MTQIFTINSKLPSLNEYINACRTNRFQAATMKRKCEEIIIAEIQNNALRPIASPCTIVFKWIEGNIRRDLDNVAFAKKFVLDALQKAEILPNDDQKYVKGFRDNFEFGNVWGCEVTINEIGGLL